MIETMKVTKNEAVAFAHRLAAMKAEAFRIGLFKTGHAMDAAVRAVGYEIADNLEAFAKRAERAKGVTK